MTRRSARVRAVTLADFEAVAASVARALRPGDVVTLMGPLGSGKTTFVAAALRALGNAAEVSSPTFTFWHRYGGVPKVEHLDFYRIDDPAQAREIGIEEAFGDDAIAFVEWPEQLPGVIGRDAIAVSIAGSGDGPRDVQIQAPPGRSVVLR